MVRARLTIQTMVLHENVTRARNGVSQSDCTTDRAPLLCPAMPLCLCTDRRARRSPACGGGSLPGSCTPAALSCAW